MKSRKAIYLTVCAVLCLLVVNLSIQAQTAETKDDETNLETQLFLILGTNQDVSDSRLPASLEPVVKELRETLPFRNYRLSATLINRVKNGGRLDLSWVGGTLASRSDASSLTPSFSQFRLREVKVVRNNEGQSMVQMLGFHFGAQIPIQTSGAIAANGAVAPNFKYENTGLATDISMRESQPVIVGTLNVGPAGEAIILVVSAKRTQK